jgi:CRP-like cAMP-binding protein
LHVLDDRVRVRDTDIALLQRVPMLRALPEATIEQLAAGLTRSSLPPGELVFAKGDHGDDFYVIERGEAEVVGEGLPIATIGPGDGFGEIALLRACERTASVRAVTSLTLCAVSRDGFVAAVVGYSRSMTAADELIAGHLADFDRAR